MKQYFRIKHGGRFLSFEDIGAAPPPFGSPQMQAKVWSKSDAERALERYQSKHGGHGEVCEFESK